MLPLLLVNRRIYTPQSTYLLSWVSLRGTDNYCCLAISGLVASQVLFYTQLAKTTHLILTERLEQRIQPHLEQLMKDLVCCSLDGNIPVQSDVAERRLFDCAVEAIDYYWPVQPPTPTESVFLWLAQLILLVGPATDPNRTESKSLSDNCGKINGDMSNGVGDEELVKEEELGTEDLEGLE